MKQKPPTEYEILLLSNNIKLEYRFGFFGNWFFFFLEGVWIIILIIKQRNTKSLITIRILFLYNNDCWIHRTGPSFGNNRPNQFLCNVTFGRFFTSRHRNICRQIFGHGFYKPKYNPYFICCWITQIYQLKQTTCVCEISFL